MAVEKTYVCENTEVRLTGRVATRPSTIANKPALELVEITPVHEYDGLWKRWVAKNTLFSIKD